MARLRSNSPCWCGSGAKYKRCHGDRRALQRQPVELGVVSAVRAVPDHIERPDYVAVGQITTSTDRYVHTDESLERFRRAGRVAAEVLLRTGAAVAPGVTTDELDAIAHEAYIELGSYPSDLGYGGSRPYPKSICASVNGVVCHGIPDSRPLEEGDIVNVDVTAYIGGMHGDTSATFCVGEVDDATRGLVETTRLATLEGIAAVAPGEPMRRIAEAVEAIAHARGYEVVAEYGGHGIGETFHCAPHINHAVQRRDNDPFVPGMSFTVEPMLLSGGRAFSQAEDRWTEHTNDAMPSAQFEHSVVVTETGVEIVTVTDDGRSAVGTLADLGTVAEGGIAVDAGR